MQRWNAILDDVASPINPSHTWRFYQYWNNGGTKFPHGPNNIWTNLFGKRYLWTDGNYAWSFVIFRGDAVGDPRGWLLPPLEITGYPTLDTTDFRSLNVKRLIWVDSAMDAPLVLNYIKNMEHNPRCAIAITDPESYYESLPKKSKYEIRKAESRGYRFEEIEPLDRIDEIIEIHKSDTFRQNKPMPDELFDRNVWITAFDTYKKYLNNIIYGVLLKDKLVAYIHPTLGRDVAFFQEYMTHKAHYSQGIGNYMFFKTYEILYDIGIEYVLGAYAPRRPDIQRFYLSMNWFLLNQWVSIYEL